MSVPEPIKQSLPEADFNDIFSSLDDFIPQTHTRTEIHTQRQVPQTQTQRPVVTFSEKTGRLSETPFQREFPPFLADWLHVLLISVFKNLACIGLEH